MVDRLVEVSEHAPCEFTGGVNGPRPRGFVEEFADVVVEVGAPGVCAVCVNPHCGWSDFAHRRVKGVLIGVLDDQVEAIIAKSGVHATLSEAQGREGMVDFTHR